MINLTERDKGSRLLSHTKKETKNVRKPDPPPEEVEIPEVTETDPSPEETPAADPVSDPDDDDGDDASDDDDE